MTNARSAAGSAWVGAALLLALGGVVASLWWSWAPCRGAACPDAQPTSAQHAPPRASDAPTEPLRDPRDAGVPAAPEELAPSGGGDPVGAEVEGPTDPAETDASANANLGGDVEDGGTPATLAPAAPLLAQPAQPAPIAEEAQPAQPAPVAEEPQDAAAGGAGTPDAFSSPPASPPPVPEPEPEPEPEPRAATAAAVVPQVRDLSGWWMVTNEVQSTSHEPFRGLRLGYRIRLDQSGDRLVGEGEKRWENGVALPPAQRTPISFEGRREGESVSLRFTERGARRTSRGVFTLQLAPDGKQMAGAFSSTAASSAGTSIARRVD